MSFDTFAIERGTSRAAIAVLIDVDPLLLERVDQGRQPLRMSHLRAIGAYFSVQLGDMQAVCFSAIESIDARLDNPKPPIPIRGDAIPSVVVRPTVPMP